MRLWMIRMVLAAGEVLAFCSPVSAGGTWFGTWQLDRHRSQLTGPSTTIERIAGGYRFDFGAVRFDVGDDGRDYPTVPTRTTSLKIIGTRAWYRVHKVNGKAVDRSTLRVSRDGRTLAIHTIAVGERGATHTNDELLRRAGDGTGLAGTWLSTSVGDGVATTIVVTDARKGRLRWAYPDQRQFYVAVPGGGPVPLRGPGSFPGVTIAVKRTSGSSFAWTEFVRGKPYTGGTDSLARDGSTLHEESWQIADGSNRQRATYVRQTSAP